MQPCLTYNPKQGLRLHDTTIASVDDAGISIRVHLRGTGVFRIWGQFALDSGETPPRWAEPELDLLLFGGEDDSPECTCRIEEIFHESVSQGFRVEALHERARVILEIRTSRESFAISLSIHNPRGTMRQSLPLVMTELEIGNVAISAQATFWSAPAYGGRTHNYGQVHAIEPPGVSFVHGCIGLALPLVYLHEPQTGKGIECEFMLDGRPKLWLRPPGRTEQSTLALEWMPSRLLAPGETHVFSGELRLRGFEGDPVAQIRAWRDEATKRLGTRTAKPPTWARRMNIIEYPLPAPKDFIRLNDPLCRAMLERWKELGYTAIFMVGHNNVGLNPLSPFDYEPREETGGLVAEQQYLQWCRELGFHIFLWITTVGVDGNSPLAKQNRDWFTQRSNGEYFYAWDSNPDTNFIGYAPDADPLATGWRDWLKGQATRIIERGYDGVFIDGCIPRADNHGRWDWPGQGRNSVEGQVVEIAEHLRHQSEGLISFVEDETALLQTNCEVTQGRYVAMAPYFPKADWDQGMGGGPPVHATAPRRIPPELARDYLRVRYASLLPGVISSDVLEGYISEATWPWVVQSLLCGCIPKTHWEYVEASEEYVRLAEVEQPSEAERAAVHRMKRHEEFVQLLKLCRDEPELLREAPLSIEGLLIEGDEAVVGILRPARNRTLLALIQFAERNAICRVRLGPLLDISQPRDEYSFIPSTAWQVRELKFDEDTRSFVGEISQENEISIELKPFSFRMFFLTHSQ